LASLEPATAGALAWLRLVEVVELVFAGAPGGFAGAGVSFSGGFWQPARIIAAKAITVRDGILFFMVCSWWPSIGAPLLDAASGQPAGFESKF
jgi:hypothetical protein